MKNIRARDIIDDKKILADIDIMLDYLAFYLV